MSTSSRRLAAATRGGKPSRTRSNKAKLYIAIPPQGGWPAFTGQNWTALGLRRK
jgi:hypothetical protein